VRYLNIPKLNGKLCELNSATTCCQSISVTALGQAKSNLSSSLGKFLFYKTGLFGRPIYRSSETQYLYLATDGAWTIGPDYNDTAAEIYHQTCKEGCPNQCTNKWKYSYNGWHVDNSIKISCDANDKYDDDMKMNIKNAT